MNVARILLFTMLSASVPILSAKSHSWYPKECCSSYDCVPADEIVSDEQGGRIVLVGQTRISIPDGFTTRSSPDGRIHVCFRTVTDEQYGRPNFFPLCLFLPAQS